MPDVNILMLDGLVRELLFPEFFLRGQELAYPRAKSLEMMTNNVYEQVREADTIRAGLRDGGQGRVHIFRDVDGFGLAAAHGLEEEVSVIHAGSGVNQRLFPFCLLIFNGLLNRSNRSWGYLSNGLRD